MQYDSCPSRKREFGSRKMGRGDMPCEVRQTAAVRPQAKAQISGSTRSWKGLRRLSATACRGSTALWTPCSPASENSETKMSVVLSHPVCGPFSRQPLGASTPSHGPQAPKSCECWSRGRLSTVPVLPGPTFLFSSSLSGLASPPRALTAQQGFPQARPPYPARPSLSAARFCYSRGLKDANVNARRVMRHRRAGPACG